MSDFGHIANKLFDLEQQLKQEKELREIAVRERDEKLSAIEATIAEQGESILELTKILERLVSILDPHEP